MILGPCPRTSAIVEFYDVSQSIFIIFSFVIKLMIGDSKRDVSNWQLAGGAHKAPGPGAYTSALTNSGAKSQVGLV